MEEVPLIMVLNDEPHIFEGLNVENDIKLSSRRRWGWGGSLLSFKVCAKKGPKRTGDFRGWGGGGGGPLGEAGQGKGGGHGGLLLRAL